MFAAGMKTTQLLRALFQELIRAGRRTARNALLRVMTYCPGAGWAVGFARRD